MSRAITCHVSIHCTRSLNNMRLTSLRHILTGCLFLLAISAPFRLHCAPNHQATNPDHSSPNNYINLSNIVGKIPYTTTTYRGNYDVEFNDLNDVDITSLSEAPEIIRVLKVGYYDLPVAYIKVKYKPKHSAYIKLLRNNNTQVFYEILEPQIDVRILGARCNNFHDDSSAINNALVVTSELKRTLIFPESKTCVIASPIFVTPGTKKMAGGSLRLSLIHI